ncbi:MAG: gluconeogenesis factor YvcK family protein [Mycoplasmatales bacterium]
MKKVVTIGGGTGLSSLLRGVKLLKVDISVIVAISDNGGSTGKIRNYYDIPAPGDLRRAVLALSQEHEIEKLMNYRFDNQLDHHTVGNLILTALVDIYGDMNIAVKKYGELLNVKHRIFPVTSESIHLKAQMEDGSFIMGETDITKSPLAINQVFYEDNPRINPEIIDVIENADYIILSSGSLFTSIIANLVFKEMREAIARSKAKIVYIANILTEAGETDDYKLSDHITQINKHLISAKVDYVLANNNYSAEDTLIDEYRQEKAKCVRIDNFVKKLDVQVIENNYVDFTKNGHIRHKIPHLLVDLLELMERE